MVLKIAIVIPVDNNTRLLNEIVKDVVLNTPFPILILDDGCETPAAGHLYAFEIKHNLENGRIRIERFEKRRGRGRRLKAAIAQLAREGFTHMQVLDADGHHGSSEINRLVEACKTHPWDLIIGDRQLPPGSTSRFADFWMNYETGLNLKDSQSRIRLYPLLIVQTMNFILPGVDFEIEALIRSVWRGSRILEVPVENISFPIEKRLPPIARFVDALKHSILNFALITVSMFKTHRTGIETALALGLGVLVGTTPFFGFHIILCVILAFVFRMNVVFVIIGSHLPNPLLLPFVLVASTHIGAKWLHVGSGKGIVGGFYQLLSGSLVLGTMLAIATVIVTMFCFWIIERRKNSREEGETFDILEPVLRAGGPRLAKLSLWILAPYFYLFMPKGRSGLNEYWALREPHLSWSRRQILVIKQFFRFAQVRMDLIMRKARPEETPKIEARGMDQADEAARQFGGVILLRAHLGGWDMPALAMSAVDGAMKARTPNEAIFEIQSQLKNGHRLEVWGDRPLGDRFELIPFCGRLAPFDVTPFRVVAATGAPVCFVFAFRKSNGSYEFVIEPNRVYTFNSSDPRPLQCREWALSYARAMEKFLSKYPDQWFNFFNFWSTPPLNPAGKLGALTFNTLIEELEGPPVIRPL